jgi:hypothetical protein
MQSSPVTGMIKVFGCIKDENESVRFFFDDDSVLIQYFQGFFSHFKTKVITSVVVVKPMINPDG